MGISVSTFYESKSGFEITLTLKEPFFLTKKASLVNAHTSFQFYLSGYNKTSFDIPQTTASVLRFDGKLLLTDKISLRLT